MTTAEDILNYICFNKEPAGTLDFTVVGDTIVEDTKITGSEY